MKKCTKNDIIFSLCITLLWTLEVIFGILGIIHLENYVEDLHWILAGCINVAIWIFTVLASVFWILNLVVMFKVIVLGDTISITGKQISIDVENEEDKINKDGN